MLMRYLVTRKVIKYIFLMLLFQKELELIMKTINRLARTWSMKGGLESSECVSSLTQKFIRYVLPKYDPMKGEFNRFLSRNMKLCAPTLVRDDVCSHMTGLRGVVDATQKIKKYLRENPRPGSLEKISSDTGLKLEKVEKAMSTPYGFSRVGVSYLDVVPHVDYEEREYEGKKYLGMSEIDFDIAYDFFVHKNKVVNIAEDNKTSVGYVLSVIKKTRKLEVR